MFTIVQLAFLGLLHVLLENEWWLEIYPIIITISQLLLLFNFLTDLLKMDEEII